MRADKSTAAPGPAPPPSSKRGALCAAGKIFQEV